MEVLGALDVITKGSCSFSDVKASNVHKKNGETVYDIYWSLDIISASKLGVLYNCQNILCRNRQARSDNLVIVEAGKGKCCQLSYVKIN